MIREVQRRGARLPGSRRVAAVLLTGVLLPIVLLAVCSGPSAPSKQQVVAKLQQDPDFAQIRSAVSGDQYATFVGCVADFLLGKANQGDLSAYVHGSRPLEDVRGFASQADAQAAGTQCAARARIGAHRSSPAMTSPS